MERPTAQLSGQPGVQSAIAIWDSMSEVRRRRDLGPAVTLCYEWLWFSAGGRPSTIAFYVADLAAAFGRDQKAARKWLERLSEVGLIERTDVASGKWSVYVFGPRLDELTSTAADPQRELFETSEVSDTLTFCDQKVRPADLLTPKGQPKGQPHWSQSESDVERQRELSQRLAAMESAIEERARSDLLAPKGQPPRSRSKTAQPSSALSKTFGDLDLDLRGSFEEVRSEDPPQAEHLSGVDVQAEHRARVERLTDEVCEAIGPELRRSVARHAVLGAIDGLYDWSDVRRMIDFAVRRSPTTSERWKLFVGAAKQKYCDVKKPWPGGKPS